MLVNETGPFGLITKLRALTGVVHDDSGRPIGYPDYSVFECVWCMSVWTALIMLILPAVFSIWLAGSTLSIAVSKVLK